MSHRSAGRERRLGPFPRALADAGLPGSVGARDLVVLTHSPYRGNERTADPRTVRELTLATADTVTRARDKGYIPLVCGGEGSALLGCGLALARTGRYALVYLAAQHNYRWTGSGDAWDTTSADLAIVTGTGTGLLTDIEDRRPYFREEDVLTFGFRYPEAAESWMLDEVRRTRIGLAALEDGRALGMEWVGRALADSYEKQPALDGFWVHLDADVLDPAYLGRTDVPETSGLTSGELATLLARLLRSPRFVGMDVTAPRPELEANVAASRTLVEILSLAFRARRSNRS